MDLDEEEDIYRHGDFNFQQVLVICMRIMWTGLGDLDERLISYTMHSNFEGQQTNIYVI